MATQNNFKSTAICGIFTNSDYPDGSILANGTFNRDLYVKGNLYLGNETGTTGSFIDTGANIKFTILGVVYTVTPAMLQKLIIISAQTLATQNYVNNQITALIASSPATLNTLNELALALGNDPNFATTTANNIASKVSIAGDQEITGIKTFTVNPECSAAATTGYQLINKNYCDGTFATLANNCDNTTLQTITGQKIFNNSLNVFYGDGSNLTGVLKTLPSALMYRNLIQTITAVHTYNVIPVSSVVPTTDYQFVNKKFCDDTFAKLANVLTIALTGDDGNGDFFIPFSKTSSATSNTLYIDNTTTPLTYNPHDGRLSTTSLTIGSSNMAQGMASSLIYQIGSSLVYINNGTDGWHRFFANDALNNQIEPLYITSTVITASVPLTINGLYIGNNTDMPSNTSEIRLYTNIWMDTINENYMRFFNKSTTATGGFGFYCGSNSVRTLIIDNTGLLSSVPITSTSTVSGATLQSSGNIYLTNSSAFILTSTAAANLSIGTPTGGGGLYLNGQGNTGILITGTAITNNLPTTFTGTPPICSTLPPTGSSLANKDYVDYSSTPIGTIVLYSSDTIPNGWLLCDGQFVSTISYASLFAVIGYTYNNGVPPATGNFALPNFNGVYTRGKGSRSGLITSTTILGQLQTASAGSHSHTIGNMSTDTQGTTGTVSVVSGVTGSVVQRQTVSNGVVTTQSTTGTGNTTIKSYDGFGVENHAELRPNNISMNYIIKFTGTPNAITVPSFTQAGSMLVISNNYATNGLMNLTMRNSSGAMQTPLQLTTTVINATVPISCSSAPSIGDHLVNKTYCDNLVSSGANFVTTNTDQTIAGVKTMSNNLITNADVFGRNDGNAFNTYTTFGTLNLYPIGYCFEVLGGLIKPVNGANEAGVAASINLTNGVWAISGYLVLNKGNGAYVAASSVSVLWDNVVAARKYPSSSGMRFPLITTNTTAQLIIPLGTINVVVTTAGVIQTITRSITMTVGTSTTWQVSFTGVKIA